MARKKTSFYLTGLVAVAALAIPAVVNAAEATKPDPAPAPTPPPKPGLVATVNGKDITRDDLVSFMMKRYGSAALDQLVDQEILEQAAAKQGITVTQKDLDLGYEAFKGTAPTPQVFDEYEKRIGKNVIMEQRIRPDVLKRKIGEKLVTVKDSDLDEVRASHILIIPERATDDAGRAKADADALKKAQDVLAEVKKPGADFAALATKYSQDPSAKTNKGDLNFFMRGQMVKPFEDAAFAAKVGDIIGPVKTDFGYHIIKVTDRKEASKLPPAQLEAKRAQVITRLSSTPVSQWIAKQKKDAVIQKYTLDTTK
jgi:foldase protein PrsA